VAQGVTPPNLFLPWVLTGYDNAPNLSRMEPTHMTTTTALITAINDLAQAFRHEAKGQPESQLTREAVLEGSVLIDPRNLDHKASCSLLSKNLFIEKFGKHQGVWYYTLTHKGFNAINATR
jgi:hypothetical protein